MKYLLVAIFITCHAINTFSATDESIKFCDTPFPPYTKISHNGEIDGPSIQFVKEVFKRLEIPLTFNILPWKRLLVELRSGNCDGVNFLLSDKKRESYSFYTIPVYDSVELCVWSMALGHDFPKGKVINFEWNSFKDFSYIRKDGIKDYLLIGKVRGYVLSKEFQIAADKKHLKFYDVTNLPQLVNMMIHRRIPLMVLSRNSLEEQLTNMGSIASINNFHCSKKKSSTASHHMAISKNSKWLKHRPNLLNGINAVIKEIKLEGLYTVQANLLKVNTN